MKTLISHLLILPMLFLMIAAATSSIDKSIVGSWSFTANSAPWEYNSGTIVFEENKDAIEGKIVFHTGREVAINSISQEEEEITFDIVVDGYDARIVFTVKENEISGHAMTIEGNMPFTANREISEE